MRSIILAIIILILCPALSFSEPISKEQWSEALHTVLPTMFCQPAQYFRQCFHVSQQECEQTSLSATRVCIEKNKNNIPEILNQPRDGSHWGTVIGTCAGTAYELTLNSKRINSEKCNDVNNWK